MKYYTTLVRICTIMFVNDFFSDLFIQNFTTVCFSRNSRLIVLWRWRYIFNNMHECARIKIVMHSWYTSVCLNTDEIYNLPCKLQISVLNILITTEISELSPVVILMFIIGMCYCSWNTQFGLNRFSTDVFLGMIALFNSVSHCLVN